jgi:hypothetical protein
MKKVLSASMLVLLIAAPILAQQKEEPTTRVYKVMNRRASDLAQLLIGLKGENQGMTAANNTFNTITVTGNEKVHERVQEILSEYDIPEKTIGFQFFLIKASASGVGIKDGVPEKVQKALKDVASLTRFKSFELIDSPYLRTKEGDLSRANLTGKGIYDYQINLNNISVNSQINIFFQIHFSVPAISTDGKPTTKSIAELSTPFSIAEGEIVVIGASQIDREGKEPGAAIITIVTAKLD